MRTECLRCGTACQSGTPDPKARAIGQATQGLCANCMITRFLLCIEPIAVIIAVIIDGNERHEGKGPEIFFDEKWTTAVLRPVLQRLLSHTQMPEDSINWIEVVGNWGMSWPAGLAPQFGEIF